MLAIATEYIHGAKPRLDDQGRQIAGDAEFGPLSDTDPDGRAENSDFYDYLGVRSTFPTDGRKERPDSARARSLDCSGYLRMVYGYRLGYPLRGTNTEAPGCRAARTPWPGSALACSSCRTPASGPRDYDVAAAR